MTTFSIHSNLDGQKYHFANNVIAPTEEDACAKALVVMGMSYETKKQKKATPKLTWKELLEKNGCHLRKIEKVFSMGIGSLTTQSSNTIVKQLLRVKMRK